MSTISVPVNLCNRPGAVGCDGEQSPYNDAFASSYFEMRKMFGLMGGGTLDAGTTVVGFALPGAGLMAKCVRHGVGEGEGFACGEVGGNAGAYQSFDWDCPVNVKLCADIPLT